MEPHDFSSSLVESAIDIIKPVLENAMVLSGHYAKARGSDIVTSKDVEYCMKYCAMHTVGQHIGSLFPEIYDSDDSEEEEFEVEEENEEDFEPYTGSNVAMNAITEAYNAWDEWIPTNPSEQLLKNAIDSNGH